MPNGHKDLSDWHNIDGTDDKRVLALIDSIQEERLGSEISDTSVLSEDDQSFEQDNAAPPLPKECVLPPELAEGACKVLDEYVEYSEQWSPRAARAYHAIVFICLLSALSARRLFVTYGGKLYTNIYALLVGQSGSYAKTTTMNIAKRIIEKLGLSELLMPKGTPQYFINRLTNRLPDDYHKMSILEKERTLNRLRFHGKTFWLYEEFGGQLDEMMNTNSNGSKYHEIIREIYDCPTVYSNGSISRGTDEIDNPYLALLGILTFQDLKPFSGSNSKLLRDGFFARMIFAVPLPGEKPNLTFFPEGGNEIPESLLIALKDYHDRLDIPEINILAINNPDNGRSKGRPDYQMLSGDYPEHEVKLSAQARLALQNYSLGLNHLINELNNEDFSPVYARLPEKALKVSAMLAWADGSDTIELKHYAKAQQLAELWRSGLHQVYGKTNSSPSREKNIEDRITALLARRKAAMDVRDIQRAISSLGSGEILKSLNSMVAAGILEVVQVESPKKRSLKNGYLLKND